MLFQLPPSSKKDLAVFDAFSTSCAEVCAAFEFRHVVARRGRVRTPREAESGAVVADSEKMSTPVRITADYAFRLRDEGYTPDDVRRRAVTIASQTASCRDVFVYFKHEEEGRGP